MVYDENLVSHYQLRLLNRFTLQIITTLTNYYNLISFEYIIIRHRILSLLDEVKLAQTIFSQPSTSFSDKHRLYEHLHLKFHLLRLKVTEDFIINESG